MRSNHAMETAAALMNANLGRRISNAEIADQVHLSEYHFVRMFKRRYGAPPHAYITEKRLNLACQLLTETDLPIAEVTKRIGYQRQAHFTFVFKGKFGVPPGKYRKDAAACTTAPAPSPAAPDTAAV